MPTTEMTWGAAQNERNRVFWQKQNALMRKRMEDPALLATAIADLKSETERRVPVYFQKSFSMALQDAEIAKCHHFSQLGRKGGRAKKRSVLVEFVDNAVLSRPNITAQELLACLEEQAGIPPFQDFSEGKIWFTNHDGNTKSAKLSGLKDLLFRAKKKLKPR